MPGTLRAMLFNVFVVWSIATGCYSNIPVCPLTYSAPATWSFLNILKHKKSLPLGTFALLFLWPGVFLNLTNSKMITANFPDQIKCQFFKETSSEPLVKLKPTSAFSIHPIYLLDVCEYIFYLDDYT
jgi:hypothetical protein